MNCVIWGRTLRKFDKEEGFDVEEIKKKTITSNPWVLLCSGVEAFHQVQLLKLSPKNAKHCCNLWSLNRWIYFLFLAIPNKFLFLLGLSSLLLKFQLLLYNNQISSPHPSLHNDRNLLFSIFFVVIKIWGNAMFASFTEKNLFVQDKKKLGK